MRPRPQWGQGWRKGGNHHLKRGFLQKAKNCSPGIIQVDLTLVGASPPSLGQPPLREQRITCNLIRVSQCAPFPCGDW